MNDCNYLKKDLEEVLQKLIFQIVEKSDSNDIDFQNLQNYLDTHNYDGNKSENEHFLHLILIISTNHHRQPHFFEKIEKILTISSKFYEKLFSSEELILIFQESKPILLSLLKTKIITIDELIFNRLMSFSEMKEGENYYYFYPELNSIIKSGAIKGISEEKYQLKLNEDIENFERNRSKFENESTICSIIREDLIDDFIPYVNRKNISLFSHIKRSFFETNQIFIEKEPTLIEYAAFYGSIQIIKYLNINNVELTSSLWLYAVHSNNPEVISFLEENQIEMDDRTFSEAIKCHHNDIANYIHYNYHSSSNITDLSDEIISIIYSSVNYEFFQYEIDGNKIFFSLCMNEYYELINLYLTLKKKEIEDYTKHKNIYCIKEILTENRLDIAYHLLSEFESIPEYFFNEFKSVKKIAIPPTVKSIGKYAFAKCSSLTQISIPPSVNSIGDHAFTECNSLTKIKIPSTVSIIADYTFHKCTSLTQVIIPPSVTLIGQCAFYQCMSLKQITLPLHLIDIKIQGFCLCSSLKQIFVPSFVKSIGHATFCSCSSLTQITIPSSIDSFEDCVFDGCTNLDTITILHNDDVRIRYFENTFVIYKSNHNDKCYDTILWAKPNMNKIIVPKFIKIIGGSVFSNFASLTQITIPSSVLKIEDCAFYRCSSLTQIIIPSSVTLIGENAFCRCSSLTEIIIPSSVTSIKKSAFNECLSLTQVTIPSTVSKIEDYTFLNCSSLTEITFEVPSSIKSIGKSAFCRCSSLKQISIPLSVVVINHYSFYGCSSLTQITIPLFVTRIGDNAFSECSSLTQISIPSFIKIFGNDIFSGIQRINLTGDIKKIPKNLFFNSSLIEISILSPVIEIGDSAFEGCLSLTKVSIPSSVKSIGKKAFHSCSSLTQISIPSSVTSIDKSAFGCCFKLKQMTIPSCFKAENIVNMFTVRPKITKI